MEDFAVGVLPNDNPITAIMQSGYNLGYDTGYRAGQEAAQPKWISVEERLPGDPLDGSGEVVELLIEKHGTVLEVLPGYYDHHEKDWLVYLGDPTGEYLRDQPGWWDVIKWRQMPEPPKEGA